MDQLVLMYFVEILNACMYLMMACRGREQLVSGKDDFLCFTEVPVILATTFEPFSTIQCV